MTNLEKYLDKILEVGVSLAANKAALEPIACDNITCKECLFYHQDDTCLSKTWEWLFEEAD